MAVDFASRELGTVLGTNIQTMNNLNQTAFDSEAVTNINIVGLMTTRLATSCIVTQKNLDPDVLSWDHPVYGDLDIQEWDGTYASTSIIRTIIN